MVRGTLLLAPERMGDGGPQVVCPAILQALTRCAGTAELEHLPPGCPPAPTCPRSDVEKDLSYWKMERAGGIEPPTFSLGS